MDFAAEQIVLISLLVILLVAFVSLETRKGGKTISVHEMTRLMNRQSAMLVDIREAAEYNAGHITGAYNIPFASMATRADELEKSKAQQVILVDKMGQHTNAAGKTLIDKGFSVVRLRGGMAEWQAQSLPLVKA